MRRSIYAIRLGRSALCAGFLAAANTNVAAQGDGMPAIWTGARIRVTSPALGPQRQVVTVLRQHADTLVVRGAGGQDSTTLRASDITRLELSRGKQTRVKKGMLVGAISGAVLGGVISYATYEKPDYDMCFYICPRESRSNEAALGAVGGGMLGAIVGGAAGFFWRVERWEYLPVNWRGSSLRVVPIGGGLALSAAF